MRPIEPAVAARAAMPAPPAATPATPAAIPGRRPAVTERGRRRGRLAAGLALVLAAAGGWPAPAPAAERLVYSEGLAEDWRSWAWKSRVDLEAAGGLDGSQALAWETDRPWGGLYLHTRAPVLTGAETALVFALRASRDGQPVRVSVHGEHRRRVGRSASLAELGGEPPAGTWTWYRVPLSTLGAAGRRITGVVLQDAGGAAQPPILIDDLRFIDLPDEPPEPPGGGACGEPSHPEIRWENAWPNQTRGRPTDPARFSGDPRWRAYYDRIDGDCTGTTEEILEWAARKWGFDLLGYPDLAKAMGVVETWWRQGHVGTQGEVGILQVHPAYWPDWEPAAWSTAYAADYAMAVVRSYYDGQSWLGDATRGDLPDAVAAWQCGCAGGGDGLYAARVFEYDLTKPWLRPGQPPEWF
jgi:autotransporter family porin